MDTVRLYDYRFDASKIPSFYKDDIVLLRGWLRELFVTHGLIRANPTQTSEATQVTTEASADQKSEPVVVDVPVQVVEVFVQDTSPALEILEKKTPKKVLAKTSHLKDGEAKKQKTHRPIETRAKQNREAHAAMHGN